VSASDNGLTLSVSFDEPLRTGKAVTWALGVENRAQAAVTLRFSSGKDGDVSLRREGREVYRWSAGRLFSQALREVTLAPGDSHDFRLEERSLGLAAGGYELVAELGSDPTVPPLRRPVELEP
jgi:hypothetical protein